MSNLLIILFILILVYILLCVDYPKTLQDTLWTHCKRSFAERVYGSYRGGFMKNRPFNLDEVKIIDVANLAGSGKKYTAMGQKDRMSFYIDLIEKYHKAQGKIPPRKAFIYVIKNYKNLNKKHTEAPPISGEIWKRLRGVVTPQLRIALAEDYNNYSKSTWVNSKNHYLRGRDDFLCFYIAQNYKKKYTKAIIYSNDRFKDFSEFIKVPQFTATYLWYDDGIKILKEKINTQKRKLGQYRDYNTAPLENIITII